MSDSVDPASIVLFKSHFKHDPEQALNKIHLVAYDLGPENCRSILVPLLFEYQEKGDDLVKYFIAIAWRTVSKFVGGGLHFKPILLNLEHILSQEEPFIREKGVESFLNIIYDDESFACPAVQISLINDTVCPILKRLANDDWFAAPSSACSLIPKIYPLASPQNQADLLQCYHNMCETTFVLVKLAASRNLKDLFNYIDIEDAISLFWLALKNIANDPQDRIRIEALESCISFGKRCTSEQNESFNMPIIKDAMQDQSWRVRKQAASLFTQIYSTFGARLVDEHLSTYISQLMNDKVEWVRSQAIESFVQCVVILESSSIELYKNQIMVLPVDANPENRKHAISILATIAQDINISRSYIKSILDILLNDNHHLVKLALLSSMNLFQGELAIEDKIIHGFLDELKTNSSWRVRLSLVHEIKELIEKGIIDYNFSDVILILLLDHVYKVRITTIEILQQVKDMKNWDCKGLFNKLCQAFEKRSLPAVIQENGSLNYKLRITIIRALKTLINLDESAVINVLKLALEDPVPNVRMVSQEVLMSICPGDNWALNIIEEYNNKMMEKLSLENVKSDENCSDETHDLKSEE